MIKTTATQVSPTQGVWSPGTSVEQQTGSKKKAVPIVLEFRLNHEWSGITDDNVLFLHVNQCMAHQLDSSCLLSAFCVVPVLSMEICPFKIY